MCTHVSIGVLTTFLFVLQLIQVAYLASCSGDSWFLLTRQREHFLISIGEPSWPEVVVVDMVAWLPTRAKQLWIGTCE